MVQQSMQHMMSNPQLLEQMIRNNPLLAGNPQAAEVVGGVCGWSYLYVLPFFLDFLGKEYSSDGKV